MSSLALARPRALPSRRSWLPADLLGAAVAIFAAALLLRPVPSGDLGWHLRTGDWILAHHSIPTTDIYSFTRNGAAWVEQEWLWQLVMALVNAVGGQVAIAAVNALIAGGSVGLVYLAARLRTVSSMLALAGAIASLAVMLNYADARPSLLIALCSAALIGLFEAYRRDRDWRWLAGAVAVEVIWANCHGSYAIGFGLCGIYGLGTVWDQRQLRAATPWALVLAGLMAGSLLNPLGPGLWHFTAFASGLTFNREFVGEWKALDLRSPVSLPLEVSFGLSVAAALLAGRRISKPQLLMVPIAIGLTVYSLQFVLLYAVAAAPVVGDALQARFRTHRLERLSPLTGLCLLAMVTVGASVSYRALQPAAYEAALARAYPIDALAYIQAHNLPGPIWNDFDWGGYLIGARPDIPVAVDGRTEMYGDAFMHQWEAVTYGFTPPYPTLEAFGIKLVLIKPDAPLARELRQPSSGWREAYRDDVAAVFVRYTA